MPHFASDSVTKTVTNTAWVLDDVISVDFEKVSQIFSVHTTAKKFENSTNFVFKLFSVPIKMQKLTFSNAYGFKSVFEKLRFLTDKCEQKA